MVVGKFAPKLNNFNMEDGLDLSLDNLRFTSPSRKLTAEAGRGAGDCEDDTESFNEEDCLFGDRYNEEDEVHEGGQYSKATARRSSAHMQPHSAPPRRAHSVHVGNRNDEVIVDADSRASTWLNSACLQPNSANVELEEDDAYRRALCHSSKALAKLNTGRPRPNPASSRLNLMRHEKENENPCDNNYGHSSGDTLLMRIRADLGHGCEPFASYDDRSSPVDIVPSSSSSPIRRSRRAKKNTGSVRASLLAEAWERKRELMLNEELANFKDRPKPELLGRSSSDCGKLISDAQPKAELQKSRTRSLTADDFDELRGCIDLGFRFDQSSVPDLCETLPALEVYCAVAQNFPESPTCMSPVIQSPARCASPSTSASSWKISSPGSHHIFRVLKILGVGVKNVVHKKRFSQFPFRESCLFSGFFCSVQRHELLLARHRTNARCGWGQGDLRLTWPSTCPTALARCTVPHPKKVMLL